MQFQVTPTAAGTELRLLDGTSPIGTSGWALSGRPGAGICQRWLLADEALEDDFYLLVEHAAISRLSAAEAARLDLPAATQLRAVVEGSGVMVRPDFRVALRWTRANGQNVLDVSRVGAWLREADGWRRLPETIFAVADAVDAHGSAGQDEAARLRALAALRRALPPAAIEGTAEASGLLQSVTIIEADALSLETSGEGDDMRIVPVLHRAGQPADAAPLLPPHHAQSFGTGQFYKWPTARGVYSLPGGVFVTIAPPLRQALDVVHRTANASPAERRAFFREPRPAIRAAIGDESDSALLDDLIVETAAWSERVIGLGLWKKRVIPWVALQANDWFAGAEAAKPRGLIVGDQHVPLTPRQAADLSERIVEARLQNQDEVTLETDEGVFPIPASEETGRALQGFAEATDAWEGAKREHKVLLIKPNETERDIEAAVVRRAGPPLAEPNCLASTLKDHQKKGLAWLQRSWMAGAPGVLLADDMGLGKTLQGLALLAWLREGMAAGLIERRPVLIVAPTGLLYNWLAEHETHLRAPGLGQPLLAFAKGLAQLRNKHRGIGSALDTATIRDADWVLTTYETLRDYDKDLGSVHFAAMLLDEAQKVKTPGIRMTDAAKAMHADFRIAMTGTPVENRLSDLWCIIDGVAPGHLGDLRRFSQLYESDGGTANLAELKTLLDRSYGGRPPMLLRRLKEDELPGLPARRDIVTKCDMSGGQLRAYELALDIARDDQAAGRVLQALQRIRAVSLHPDPDDISDDSALILDSARLRTALAALDEIAAAGERALVFVEDLTFMARLTGLLQRRYNLASPPMTISGAVAGATRQARVDRFQFGPPGFDVMLLSPRAGGVGLTLTRANHVIHLTRWWNPAVEDQSTARVLRIGQEKPVTVHIPLATLPGGRPSFDENLNALLERKRRLMRHALLPPEAGASELSTMLEETVAEVTRDAL